MKYMMLLNCLVWTMSCAPKYTASFQDYSNTHQHDLALITTLPEEIGVTNTLVSSAPGESTASIEIKPGEFKREALIDLSSDTVVTAKQDTILLKNGDRILGRITQIASGKLVCRVSEWKIARTSKLKKGMMDTDQVILLKDVFLIKYSDGTSESVKFSEKVSTTSASKAAPKKNAFAVFGLILGVLSLIPFYGLLLSIPAILLSLIGLKSEKRSLATVGLVLGILGLTLGVVWLSYLMYWMWI